MAGERQVVEVFGNGEPPAGPRSDDTATSSGKHRRTALVAGVALVVVVIAVAIITAPTDSRSTVSTTSTSSARTPSTPAAPPATNAPEPGLYLAPSAPAGFTLAEASNANPVTYIPPANRQLWAEDPASPATSRWFRIDATDDPSIAFNSGRGRARISTTHGVAVIGTTDGVVSVTGPIAGGHGSVMGRGLDPDELVAILEHVTLRAGALVLDGSAPPTFREVASETPEQAKTNANRPAFDTEAAVLTYQSIAKPGQVVTVSSGAYESALDIETDRYRPAARQVAIGSTSSATVRTSTESLYASVVLKAVVDRIPVAVSGNVPSETLVSFARTLRPISPAQFAAMKPAKTVTFESTDDPSTGPIAHGVFADGITWRVFLANAGPDSPLRLTLITVPNRPADADEADTTLEAPGSIQLLATVHGTVVIAVLPVTGRAATLHVNTGDGQLESAIDVPSPDGAMVLGVVATQAFGIPDAHTT